MKKLTSLLIAGALSSAMASNYIMAIKYNGNLNSIDGDSPVWKMANFADIELYPQTTIKLNDKKANSLNSENLAKKVKVAAVYNNKDIAFKVIWADATENVFSNDSTNSYADGFALQFPQNYSDISKLPYIGMGSKDRAVIVHLQKAYKSIYEPNGNGDVATQVNRDNAPYFEGELRKFDDKVAKLGNVAYQRSFISEGFRSMTEIKDNSEDFKGSMKFANNKWEGTLTRPLKDSYLNLNSGAVPVAFAVWDGDKMGRDGLKQLSSWIPVKLVGKSGGDEFADKVNEKSSGDVANGKKLVAENCTACHSFKGSDNGMPYMAPNLSNIGGYSTTAYLRESILNPSAVVVPGYNRNAHKNYAWYNLDEKGERVSAMPAYDWMDAKSVDDIVAFLETLKEEVKK